MCKITSFTFATNYFFYKKLNKTLTCTPTTKISQTMNVENAKRTYVTVYIIVVIAFAICYFFAMDNFANYRDNKEICKNNYSQTSGGGRTSQTIQMKVHSYIRNSNDCGENLYQFTVAFFGETGQEQSYVANRHYCYGLDALHGIGRIGAVLDISYDTKCDEVFDTVGYTKQKADDSCPLVSPSWKAGCFFAFFAIVSLFADIQILMHQPQIVSWLTTSRNGPYEIVAQNNVEMPNVV